MKIALLSDWFFPRRGGIESQICHLADQLQKNGHTVHIITPIAGPTKINDIPVHRLPGPLLSYLQLAWHPATFRAYRKLLEKEAYDIVHVHFSLIAPTSLIGGYITQKAGIPTLVTFHSLIGSVRWLMILLRQIFQMGRWSVSYSAVSQSVADDFAAIVAPQSIDLLPNSINHFFWKAIPPQPAKSDATVQLVTVTRFSPRKRSQALIRLFHRLRQERPDISIHLTIIGTGSKATSLKQTVKRLKLTADITFTGYLTAESIRTILSQSDIFILPSIHESFGIAALEARTAGLPVLAFRQSGVRSFIRSGVEGLLATTDEELYQHLVYLCDHPHIRHQIAQHNWESVPPYNWTKQTEQHIDQYVSTIAQT